MTNVDKWIEGLIWRELSVGPTPKKASVIRAVIALYRQGRVQVYHRECDGQVCIEYIEKDDDPSPDAAAKPEPDGVV